MKLVKIHRILQFQQAPWLKSYIDFNTRQRAAATNDFEKNFFKLMNNSVFGKTMENLRNCRNINLVEHEFSAERYAAQPTFKSYRVFQDNLMAIERKKASLLLNKPIYVGFAVLDLSKTLMYDFHYNYIKIKYPGNQSKLLFTDTDSLCYLIRTDSIHQDMYADKQLFDFSDYEKDSAFYNADNKKVIGKMKDETHGINILEFVGLRPKMYSFTTEKEIAKGVTEKKVAKGVKKSTINKDLRFDQYKDVLFNETKQMNTMNLFRSDRHNVFTSKINKTTLSCYGDKRFLLNDGISSLPYGHKDCTVDDELVSLLLSL